MVIRASAAEEIRSLVQALIGADDVSREAAVARLTVIGERAVDRLIAAYPSAEREGRTAILRTLETMCDPRAIPVARDALLEGGDVAVAAAAVLGNLLGSAVASAAAHALEALICAAVDADAERRVRLAAFDALRDLPADVRTQLAEKLHLNPEPSTDPQARARAEEVDALWNDALDGRLPDDPATLREALTLRGPVAALSNLQKLVDIVRLKETQVPSAARRRDWVATRGALHQALAMRGSRVALYDLRDTFGESAGPLPPAFIAAMRLAGDETCLEEVAAAYGRATDPHWREQLAGTFKAIAKRERLTRRHAAIKRIAARWPELL